MKICVDYAKIAIRVLNTSIILTNKKLSRCWDTASCESLDVILRAKFYQF